MPSHSPLIVLTACLLWSLECAGGVRMGDEPPPPTASGGKALPDIEGGSHLLRGIMQDCVVGSAVSILTGYSASAPFGSCLRARVAESVARTDEAQGIRVTQSLSAEVDPRAAETGRGRTIATLLSTSTLMDAANVFFETRSFRWQLDGMYPGLVLRLSPSISRGDSQYPAVLEFLLEDRAEGTRQPHTNDRSYGTGRQAARLHPVHEAGRVLLKKAILPLLLGLKLKVTTIFPILFALTALLASKALFVAKFALLASGVIGLGVILFPGALAGFSGIFPFHYGGHGYGPQLFNRPYGFNGASPVYNPLLQYSAPLGGNGAFGAEDQGKGVLHHLLYDVHEGDDLASGAASSQGSLLGGLNGGNREVLLPSFGGRRNFAWEDERKRE